MKSLDNAVKKSLANRGAVEAFPFSDEAVKRLTGAWGFVKWDGRGASYLKQLASTAPAGCELYYSVDGSGDAFIALTR